ncbi:MAG: Ppx/GppA family phosphatase [Cyanobacteria bacterium]|nr:Ppx/GppA family phosphatase [Cyanobacteriota bacterium]
MKLASIDIGSNSTRLLIVDYPKENYSSVNYSPIFKIIARKTAITRISRNLTKTSLISGFSAGKTINVLNEYLNLIKKENVKKFRVVGTSALRKAKNSSWFINLVKSELGIKIDIISSSEEADLSFYGVVRNSDLISKIEPENFLILVIDIGGGSTEFIQGNTDGKIIFKESIDIGCVNLTEKFINYNKKPEIKDLEMLQQYVNQRIKVISAKIKELGFNIIFGVAGTISTLSMVDLKLKKYNRGKIHGHILRIDNIKKIYNNFCSLDFESRKKIAGLETKRADIIIGGTAILIEIMNLLEPDKIIVSENDILDGIIYSILDFC